MRIVSQPLKFFYFLNLKLDEDSIDNYVFFNPSFFDKTKKISSSVEERSGYVNYLKGLPFFLDRYSDTSSIYVPSQIYIGNDTRL
jgi:hypothetical protein